MKIYDPFLKKKRKRKQIQRRYSKVRKKKFIDNPIQLYNMTFMYIPQMNIQLDITKE